MKILTIDSNVVVRAGLNLMLEGVGDEAVLDTAEGVNDALQMIQNSEYDVVLIGLSLPDLEGFKILELIRRNKPCQPVVVVGMHHDEHLAVNAYVYGADGFVEAEKATEDLARAVEKVVKGGKFVSEKLMGAMVCKLRDNIGDMHESHGLKQLSVREKQITELLATGVTNKEIAWQLEINVKTVSTYKTRILKKLNLKNLAELVKYQLSYTMSV
jgi:DNA-binding NarL/FixJ family response regulator